MKGWFYIALVVFLVGCKNPYYQENVKYSRLSEGEKAQDHLVLNLTKSIDVAGVLSSVSEPKVLRVLILDSCDLLKLPDLSLFKNLKHLSVRHNPQMNWSDAFLRISSLEKLRFLNLSSNYLQVLPHSLTQCKQITSLRLSYNSISGESIAKTVGQLPRIKKLWIDQNKIEQLPKDLSGLKNIRYLYAYSNNLKTLPEDLGALKRLWEIHLANNQFDTLPTQIRTAKRLKMAYFGGNNISFIPTEFKKRRGQLAAITLANNPLSQSEKQKAKRYFRNFWLLDL